MRLLFPLIIGVLVLAGCTSSESPRHAALAQLSATSAAVTELNRQIEKFNAERPGDMGITPIAQRVSHVEYASARGTANCFDQKGTLFLVLSQQPDGPFKGSLKTAYHELPKPEGHSWGQVTAEFTLPREMFRDGAANGR